MPVRPLWIQVPVTSRRHVTVTAAAAAHTDDVAASYRGARSAPREPAAEQAAPAGVKTFTSRGAADATTTDQVGDDCRRLLSAVRQSTRHIRCTYHDRRRRRRRPGQMGRATSQPDICPHSPAPTGVNPAEDTGDTSHRNILVGGTSTGISRPNIITCFRI